MQSFKDLNLLSIDYLKEYSLLCFMYKIMKFQSPTLLYNSINKNKCNLRNTRQRNMIRKPQVKLSSMRKSFTWLASTLWNELLPADKDKNYNSFKKLVKIHLNNKFTNYY